MEDIAFGVEGRIRGLLECVSVFICLCCLSWFIYLLVLLVFPSLLSFCPFLSSISVSGWMQTTVQMTTLLLDSHLHTDRYWHIDLKMLRQSTVISSKWYPFGMYLTHCFYAFAERQAEKRIMSPECKQHCTTSRSIVKNQPDIRTRETWKAHHDLVRYKHIVIFHYRIWHWIC